MAIPRGTAWGLALGLPAGCFCFWSSYDAWGVLGALVALAGPFVGAFVAFHLGAAAGLYRAGWRLLLVPALAAVVLLAPIGLYQH